MSQQDQTCLTLISIAIFLFVAWLCGYLKEQHKNRKEEKAIDKRYVTVIKSIIHLVENGSWYYGRHGVVNDQTKIIVATQHSMVDSKLKAWVYADEEMSNFICPYDQTIQKKLIEFHDDMKKAHNEKRVDNFHKFNLKIFTEKLKEVE